jgi:hypothetical protein
LERDSQEDGGSIGESPILAKKLISIAVHHGRDDVGYGSINEF